jgi:hypothetical protein
VSPVKYKLGFYIPEDDILHSHRRENLNSYMVRRGVYITDLYVYSYRRRLFIGHTFLVGSWRD